MSQQNESTPANNPFLESQLQNLFGLRISGDQVYWTIFSIFCATTALLLSAFFPQGQPPSNDIVALVISFVGCGLSFVWWVISSRVIASTKYYEEIIENLEHALPIPSSYATSKKINEKVWEKHLGKGMRVRRFMWLVPLIITILWGSAFLFSFYNLIIHCVS